VRAGQRKIRQRPAGWQRRRARRLELRAVRRLERIANRSVSRTRSLHKRGVKELAALFDGPRRLYYDGSDLQGGRGKPVRLKANTPPVRDAEHQAKHRKRKAARAARKKNRH
jgi:hypothetical protein